MTPFDPLSFGCILGKQINDHPDSSSSGKLDNQRCKDPQLRRLRTDPRKPEKWRIRCTSFYKSEVPCHEHQNIKAVAGSPSHQSFRSSRTIFRDFFASEHAVNRHVDELQSDMDTFGCFRMSGQTRVYHGRPLTSIYCWVNFAKSKRCDPKLSSRFAETRSFGIILRCSFTWG